jgi:hypothetical protein
MKYTFLDYPGTRMLKPRMTGRSEVADRVNSQHESRTGIEHYIPFRSSYYWMVDNGAVCEATRMAQPLRDNRKVILRENDGYSWSSRGFAVVWGDFGGPRK